MSSFCCICTTASAIIRTIVLTAVPTTVFISTIVFAIVVFAIVIVAIVVVIILAVAAVASMSNLQRPGLLLELENKIDITLVCRLFPGLDNLVTRNKLREAAPSGSGSPFLKLEKEIVDRCRVQLAVLEVRAGKRQYMELGHASYSVRDRQVELVKEMLRR